MTVLESRPILRVKPTLQSPRRPVLLAAAVGAAWSATIGLVAALATAVAAWFAADAGSFAGAVRIGALSWLVAQGGGLHTGGVVITALPLGTCLVSGWLLYRSGRWVGATAPVARLTTAMQAAAAMALTYTLCGLLVYAVTVAGDAHADVVRTIISTGLLAAGFGGFGVVRGAGLTTDVVAVAPAEVRAILAGAAAGMFAMIAAGGLAFTASMVMHFSAAVRLAEGLHTGVVGGFILALIGLAAVPNAVLCSGAYLAGPGFALGTATTVSATSVQLGTLPALPILAATPRSGGAWWQEALVVAPLLAGTLCGVVTARRSSAEGYLQGAMRWAASGLLGGLMFGASTWLATGAIGPGRMQDIGPAVLATTAICAVAMSVGGAGGGLAWRWWAARLASTPRPPGLVGE